MSKQTAKQQREERARAAQRVLVAVVSSLPEGQPVPFRTLQGLALLVEGLLEPEG